MQNAIQISAKNICDKTGGIADTLLKWVSTYLEEEVVGLMSEHTLRAKVQDFTSFANWFRLQVGHLDIAEWMARDTAGYLDTIEGEGAAPATVNRRLATLKAFARWLLDRADNPLRFGNPTKGIKQRYVDEGAPQALTMPEANALFRAAEVLTGTETRANARPHRNLAILSLLYHTGLRVSELCGLRADQYTGTHLVNIRRKGKVRTQKLYLQAECRKTLDAYIATERTEGASWLFTAAKPSSPMTAQTVANVLNHIAQEASKHRTAPITIHPHQLRHTFGTRYLEATGSESETAKALGHSSTAYVGVYTRATDEQRADVLESISIA